MNLFKGKKMDKQQNDLKVKSYYATPYWATSFEQLDSVRAASEVEEALYELLFQYVDLVTNVMRYGNFIEPDLVSFTYDSTYAVDQIKALTQELIQRLGKIPALTMLKELHQASLEKGSTVVWSNLNKDGAIDEQPKGVIKEILTEGKFDNLVATKETPIYQIVTKSNETVYKHSGQLRKINTEAEKIFSLYKDGDSLRWFGIVTNIYQDVAKDILTEEAHLHFIDQVEKGEESYPELWIWHIEKSVGTTDWIGYDDRGFVLASGLINKELFNIRESVGALKDLYGRLKGRYIIT